MNTENSNVQDVPDDIELPIFEEPSRAPKVLELIAGAIFLAVVIVGILIIRALVSGPANPRNELENRVMTAQGLIKKNPNDVNPRIELGSAYLDWGRYDDAERELKAAIQIAPDSGDAHYLLALTYEALKEKKKAIPELAMAVKKNPAMDIAAYRLGELYRDDGRTDKAIDAFRLVLKINPSSADALYQVGLLYEKKGDKAKAVRYIKESLKYIPNYPEAQKALKRLQGG